MTVQYDINAAADALRRYEQSGKKLNDWDAISAAQRRKWRDKVRVVIDAAFDGPTVAKIAAKESGQ